jgi:hypothetical protein
MMPPPSHRTKRDEPKAPDIGISDDPLWKQSSWTSLVQQVATPAQHRTRLGPTPQPGSRFNADALCSSTRIGTGRAQQTPSQRPLLAGGGSSLNRSNTRGYGMSAGVKVGRQQCKWVRVYEASFRESLMQYRAWLFTALRPADFSHRVPERSGARFVHPLAQAQPFSGNEGSYHWRNRTLLVVLYLAYGLPYFVLCLLLSRLFRVVNRLTYDFWNVLFGFV